MRARRVHVSREYTLQISAFLSVQTEMPGWTRQARSVRKASDIRRSSHSLSSDPVTLGRHAIQSLPLRR